MRLQHEASARQKLQSHLVTAHDTTTPLQGIWKQITLNIFIKMKTRENRSLNIKSWYFFTQQCETT